MRKGACSRKSTLVTPEYRNQLQGVEFASLRGGQQIEYEVGKERNGRSEAVGVRLAQPKTE